MDTSPRDADIIPHANSKANGQAIGISHANGHANGIPRANDRTNGFLFPEPDEESKDQVLDVVPGVDAELVRKHGDTYRRGDVRIHFGDALDQYKKWPSPVAIVADGPYGVSGFPGAPRRRRGSPTGMNLM
ncbi:MAG TPA: hypothetical protein VF590_23945 [Isosphaeraceae bacterium]|jgi:hypothetical protein